jgi:hypothetical protein
MERLDEGVVHWFFGPTEVQGEERLSAQALRQYSTP